MATTAGKRAVDEVAELRQLKRQLQELECSATTHGLWLTATLIGAAFESISEEMASRTAEIDAVGECDGDLTPLRIERPSY